MLLIYIACFIFGAVFVVITMFSGGDGGDHAVDGHGDVDHALDGHGGMDHTLDAHGGLDHVPDTGAAGHDGLPAVDHASDGSASELLVNADASHASHVPSHPDPADAVSFLSFRNFVFFMTFFGMTGAILTTLSLPALVAGLVSAGMGLFSAQFGYRLLRYLKRTESGQGQHLQEFTGHTATVVIPCTRRHAGKITVRSIGQTVQMLALVAEEADRAQFRQGDTVIISRVENGIAQVIDGRLLDDPSGTRGGDRTPGQGAG